MKRALVYARVSSERQAEEGLSIESQIDACQAKARDLGATVVKVYRDDGISGTTDARPAFRAAIEHCALGGIDYLVCWSSSRFARNQRDALHYKALLDDADTRLVYASSSVDRLTQEGWLADSFAQIIDEHYSRQTSADTIRSMLKASREGYFMGGRIPFGYRAVDAPGGKRRMLQPHEEEAALVRWMFDQAARGLGAFGIAKALNLQGLTLRGQPFKKNTILNILKSEVYVGIVIFNRFDSRRRRQRPAGEWIRTPSHRGIVAPERFSEVQAAMAKRAPADSQTSPNSTHAFSSVLRCARCDSKLKISSGTGRTRTYYYYGCAGSLQGVPCSFKPLRADLFDRWMVNQLLDQVLTEENVRQIVEQMDKASATWVKDRSDRRALLVRELRAAEARRSNLYEVLELQGASAPGADELGPRIRELNLQIQQLQHSLDALEDEQEPPVARLAASPRDAAYAMRRAVRDCKDPKAVREFISSVVERIEVGADEVKVEYHPECLVLAQGKAVHSSKNWLPVLGLLRTAFAVFKRPFALGGRRKQGLAA